MRDGTSEEFDSRHFVPKKKDQTYRGVTWDKVKQVMSMCVFVCVCVSIVCVSKCVRVLVCVRERERERERGRKRERERGTFCLCLSGKSMAREHACEKPH